MVFFFPHLDSVLSTLRLPCLVPSNWTNSADFNLLETGEFASDPALETHLQHNSCRCYKFVWQQSFIHISISQICKKISLLPHQLLTPLKPQLPPPPRHHLLAFRPQPLREKVQRSRYLPRNDSCETPTAFWLCTLLMASLYSCTNSCIVDSE